MNARRWPVVPALSTATTAEGDRTFVQQRGSHRHVEGLCGAAPGGYPRGTPGGHGGAQAGASFRGVFLQPRTRS